jgi:hypothetical protein
MLSPIALTTLGNLKEELGITTSTDDAKLERLINRASTWIEGETGRKLKARNYNGGTGFHEKTGVPDEPYLYFGGQGAFRDDSGVWEYYFPQYPIISIVGFAYSPSQGVWDTPFVENTDFFVDYGRGAIRLLSGYFNPGFQNYRIACTAGYLVGDNQPYVPDDLEGLCIKLCERLYQKGVQSETIGTWSRTFETAKDDFVTDTLARYTPLNP